MLDRGILCTGISTKYALIYFYDFTVTNVTRKILSTDFISSITISANSDPVAKICGERFSTIHGPNEELVRYMQSGGKCL